jgi:hypothetical protein
MPWKSKATQSRIKDLGFNAQKQQKLPSVTVNSEDSEEVKENDGTGIEFNHDCDSDSDEENVAVTKNSLFHGVIFATST